MAHERRLQDRIPKIPGLGDAEPSLSRYVAFFK
jgi:hypothetical protein